MITPHMTLDEFERKFREGIGVEYDMNVERIVREATRDTIINFAEAVGDANPLWRNEDYAKQSRFGDIVAPPAFLFAVTHGSTPALTWPGAAPNLDLTLLFAGAELEFYQPIRRGDSFTVRGRSTGIVRKQSKSMREILFPTGEAAYYNQHNELVGVIRSTICRFNPPEQQAVHIDREEKDGFEVKSPDRLAYDRVRRGAEPRWWEDVQVGEEMTPALDKGLLTMMEILRFGILCPSSPRRIERRRENIEIGFSREEMQKRAGLEDASDFGPQRICWLGQFATDWIGDDGTLKKLTVQIRHPNIMGDSNVVRGRVTGKRAENGEHLIDCEMGVENQAGLRTAPATAVIELPSRG